MDEPRTFFAGQRWDAPIMDDCIEMREPMLSVVFDALPPNSCGVCQEAMKRGENVLVGPTLAAHTECQIRIGMGDVQHLERRCLCYRGGGAEYLPSDDYPSYRASALASIEWLIQHDRGRWKEAA